MWTSSSPGVDVRCMNGVEEKLSHADPFHVNEVGLEQSFWGASNRSPPTLITRPSGSWRSEDLKRGF